MLVKRDWLEQSLENIAHPCHFLFFCFTLIQKKQSKQGWLGD